MTEKHLSSLQNPHIKEVVHLRDRSTRDNTGLFLIEGYREILRATDAGWQIDELLICPNLFLGSNESALIERIVLTGGRVVSTSENVFQKISYRDRPDGLLAIASQRKNTHRNWNIPITKNSLPFYVVC